MNRIYGVVFALFIFIGCQQSKDVKSARYSEQQLSAHYYYDLGAEKIDVSSYPQKQQEDYRVFQKVCVQCHSLARPINAPVVGRVDWERFVRRMHFRSDQRDVRFSLSDSRKVVNFLVYDSEVRKVKKRMEFADEQIRLTQLFVKVQKERQRIQIEKGREKARPPYPYVGDKR